MCLDRLHKNEAYTRAKKVYSCRIPVLDQIRDAAYAKAQDKLAFTCVEEFYTCYRYEHPTTHNSVYELHCHRAQLIAQLADDWNEANPSFENLTFSKLGLPDIKLPFIFSAMRLELSSDAMDITGIVRVFNPKVRIIDNS